MVPLPANPETLALYLVELAEVAKASTIGPKFAPGPHRSRRSHGRHPGGGRS